MTAVPQIRYLNTDLDVVSPTDPAALIGHLSSAGVSPLLPTRGDDGLWYVTFETDEDFVNPDPNICAMLCAIESAAGIARDSWNACLRREFNIGYDCGDEPWAFNQGLSNGTLRRIAACGASLHLTLYPFRET